jgi:hypothetical protein
MTEDQKTGQGVRIVMKESINQTRRSAAREVRQYERATFIVDTSATGHERNLLFANTRKNLALRVPANLR